MGRHVPTACTHYPLIRSDIEAFFGGRVEVLDSTDVTARAVEQKLAERGLLNSKRENAHRFFVSDYTKSFAETTRLFWPGEIQLEGCPIW